MTPPQKTKPPLKAAGKKKKTSRGFLRIAGATFFVLFLIVVIVGFAGAGYIYFTYSKDLPDVRALKDFEPSAITLLYSDRDELIAEFYIEKRIMVPLSGIPLKLTQATLAVEDSNFYYHFGIDPKAIFRALITNLQAGHVVEGGSTITQQLSKTLFLSRERTLDRKIKEAILAFRMELIFSKDEILEMYLNQIYYGHGAYGVEAAARTYFGKTVRDLTVEECAMIAALPKAPSHYSPYRHPEKAKSRRNHAIRRMAHLGFINNEEAETALKTEFNLGEVTDMLNRAPYFVEYIRQFLQEKYGSNKLYRAGFKVYTTLNMDYQELAQTSIRENLRAADKRYGYRGPLGSVNFSKGESAVQEALIKLNKIDDGVILEPGMFIQAAVKSVDSREVQVLLGVSEGTVDIRDMNWARTPSVRVDGRWARINRANQALSTGDLVLVRLLKPIDGGTRWALALEQEPEVQGALITLEPQTGYIKAMVGGYDFSKSQFNRAVQAIRQPGSAFKPIVYCTAISNGFSPASVIIDSPIIFKDRDDSFNKWKPVNFEQKFYGPTTLRTAITHSRNVVTVKLLKSLGVKKAVKMAKSLGITSKMEPNLSIALGSSGVSLFDLTSAYSAFANAGKRVSPTAVRYIRNRKEETIYRGSPDITQPLSSGVAYTMNSLLQSVVQNGTAKAVKVLNRPIAGKTGTTNDYVDAWFLGFTPDLVTGVWVGKDSHDPLGYNETGSRAAIPIWLQYMKEVLKGKPIRNFPISDEVSFRKIDPATGKIANFFDPNAEFEVFLDANLPKDQTPIPTSATATPF